MQTGKQKAQTKHNSDFNSLLGGVHKQSVKQWEAPQSLSSVSHAERRNPPNYLTPANC